MTDSQTASPAPDSPKGAGPRPDFTPPVSGGSPATGSQGGLGTPPPAPDLSAPSAFPPASYGDAPSGGFNTSPFDPSAPGRLGGEGARAGYQPPAPPAQGSDPYAQAAGSHAQAPGPYAQGSDPYAQAAASYAQGSDPYAQAAASYAQASGPYAQAPDPYAQASSAYAQGSGPYAQGPAPYGQSAGAAWPSYPTSVPAYQPQPSAPAYQGYPGAAWPPQDPYRGALYPPAVFYGPAPIARPRPRVGLWQAYRLLWKNGLNFSGRASRSEYWFAALANMIVGSALAFVIALAAVVSFGGYRGYYNDGALFAAAALGVLAYCLLLIVPAIALAVRRLHDANLSGSFFLLNCIPTVGPVIGIVLCCQPSDPAGAQYDNPNQLPHEN